jgi:hypothetical protein
MDQACAERIRSVFATIHGPAFDGDTELSTGIEVGVDDYGEFGLAGAFMRERKKARTRAAIREHALRLFREHGYGATTVEQIAEAAEVSPATFYRYFPTKEDVVLDNDASPLFEATVATRAAGEPRSANVRR